MNIVCLIVGCRRDWEGSLILIADPGLSPDDRDYSEPVFYVGCSRCKKVERREPDPGEAEERLALARLQDEQEWDDPVARAEHLEAVEQAAVLMAEQWHEGKLETRPWPPGDAG